MSENTRQVRLAGKLPKQSMTNGLPDIAEQLCSTPEKLCVGIVVFDVSSVKMDIDSGDAIATVRIRRFEPISRLDDRKTIETLTRRAWEQRTGQTVLPMELEDELRAAFGDDGSAS